MSEPNELFPDGKTAKKLPPVKSWRMVTNQRNLYYMIAAGLIMPAEGFGKKYYSDTVSAFPGYLPVFPVNVSQAAVNASISEAKHLMPCVLNLDLSKLRGPVKIIIEHRKVRDAGFPDEVDSSCQLMLVPAPLPVSWISSIVCQSREEKLSIEGDAADFNNVDLSDYPIKTSVAAFAKHKGQAWPPHGIDVQPFGVSLDVAMAAGAMMGLLLNMNKSNSLAIYAARLAFDPDLSLPELSSHPVIAAMGEWLQNYGRIEGSDVSQKLFWNIVGAVSASKYSVEQLNAIDVAVDYLATMPGDQFDEKARDYGGKLSADLKDILGLADSTISEIFDRHPKPVSRAVTLFVLREKVEDLLEFDNAKLTEADYILAAILFAAREGWIGLSKDLRKFPGLNAAVCHRMAAIAHYASGSKMNLGEAPARPQSLLELLSPGASPMTKTQKEAALFIARALKWNCIQTRVNLGKGNYKLGVTSAGIQLTLDGDVKAVVTEVLEEEFFDMLKNARISDKVDGKVREILKVAK